MIGLLIVAHGDLAPALLAATEHVVGPQRNARSVAIAPTDDPMERQAEIDRLVAEIDEGDGVVLITDLFGGSPANLALGSMRTDRIEVIWGANLPLLVKLAKLRDRPLAEAVQAAIEAGHRYIDSASRILDPERARRVGE
ncbi:MAG: PTS sugar transporter subunit IIA [Paracoccaceae bacterium]